MKKLFMLYFIVGCFYTSAAEAQSISDYYAAARRNTEREKTETYQDVRGFTYTKRGNTIYKNNGTVYHQSGNTITGSDGSRYETSHGMIYHNGRENCQIKGQLIVCH